MLVAFGMALVLTAALTLYLSKTFTGRAIKAVAQDEPALRLMGANPVRIKQWAFGIATGVSALAGAMLIIVGPVEPALDRAVHRAHLLRGGAGGPGQHDRDARRGPDPRHLGVHRADDAGRFVGAGSGFRPPSDCSGGQTPGAVRSMKYWIGAALVVIAAFAAALSGVNEYFFYAAYIVLTFVVLSTAWNILGGYAGYVNFGTGAFFGLGSYSAVVLFKALEAPLLVQILAGAAIGAALGFGVGIMTLRLRGIFFAIATVAILFIMETFMVNWRYVGGATGLQLLRPEVMAPFGSYTRMLFVVMALLAVVAVSHRALHPGVLDRARPARHPRLGGGGRVLRRADAQAEALRLRGVGRADGRGRRADADVPLVHRAGVELQPQLGRRQPWPCR